MLNAAEKTPVRMDPASMTAIPAVEFVAAPTKTIPLAARKRLPKVSAAGRAFPSGAMGALRIQQKNKEREIAAKESSQQASTVSVECTLKANRLLAKKA